MVCTLFTGEDLCTMISYNAVEDKFSESVKQLAACDACFLGIETEKDPAIALLNTDKEHIMIYTFNDLNPKYGKTPQGQITLSARVKNVYRTPINKGFTVVYQLHKEHILKFSKNRKEGDNWDFDILDDNDYSMRLKYDEVALDLIWQHKNSCAINTNQRIIITDNKLTLLHEFNLANLRMSSSITSSWWLGNTLLFTNYTHLFYLVPSEAFTPCAIISFPEPRILVGALLDRVFTFQQNVKQKAPGVNMLPITLHEPLIVGYLATLKKENITKEEVNRIAELLARLTGGLISTNLIQALNRVGMNSSAMELVSRPSNSQFTKRDKVEQAIKKGDCNKTIELLADIREGTSPTEEAIIELMLQTYSDPTYKFEKEKLRDIMSTAISMGQYKLAYLCAEFLNDQIMGYKILLGLSKEKVVIRLLNSLRPENSENVMQTDLECLISAHQKKKGGLVFEERTLRNWKIEVPFVNDKFVNESKDSPMLKLKMEDKKITYQTQQMAHNNLLETKDLPNVKDSSLTQWFGYDLMLEGDVVQQRLPEQYI